MVGSKCATGGRVVGVDVVVIPRRRVGRGGWGTGVGLVNRLLVELGGDGYSYGSVGGNLEGGGW